MKKAKAGGTGTGEAHSGRIRSGKIRNQLLLVVGALVAVAMLVLGGVNLLIAYNSLYEADMRWLQSVASEGKTSLESWMELNIYSMNTCASYANDRSSKAARTTYLESVRRDFESMPKGLYVGYDDDFLIYPGVTTAVRQEMKEFKNQDWYVRAMENKGIQYTDTFVDASTGERYVTLSCMLRDGFSVLAGDVSLAAADEKLSAMDLMDGRALLVDREGQIISCTDEALEGQALAGLFPELAQDLQQGAISDSYVMEETKFLVAVEQLEELGWQLVTAIPESSILEDCLKLGEASMLCFVLSMLVLMLVLTVALAGLTRPIIRVNNYMAKVARGDLKDSLSVRSRTEIGTMVRSVNESVGSIRGMVTDIKSAVKNLEQETGDCRTAAAVLEEQSNSINSSSEIIADNMNQLSTSAATVAEMAEKVNTAVGGIVNKGEDAREALGSAIEATQTGQTDIESVSSEITEVKNAVTELAATVGKAEELTAQISKIIAVIQDIASETNLLSLNASIEAARAGEEGKGFAVVAGEIKKLADNSAHSAEDIARMIIEIERIIQMTVAQTKENVERIDGSVAVVDKTRQSFALISESVENIHGKVNGMLEDIQQVDDSAQTFAAVSQEQMAGVEEIAATVTTVKEATGSNLTSVGGMKESVEQLNLVLEQLKHTANRFQVEE